MCLSHLIYTVRLCLIHTCNAASMPCPDHVVLQGHGTARPSRGGLWATCSCSVLPATTRNSTKVVIRRISISDAVGQCETIYRLSRTRKRVVAAHHKIDDLLHCWTSSLIFPATMRSFTKETALLEQGRGAAWHV